MSLIRTVAMDTDKKELKQKSYRNSKKYGLNVESQEGEERRRGREHLNVEDTKQNE